MTITEDSRATEAERRAELRWLATSWEDIEGAERARELMEVVHPSLCGMTLQCAWDSYLGHLRLHFGINGVPGFGEVSWSDINDELTGPDRTGDARDEIAERVAADEDLLLRGVT